jgi:hypothetical protein
MTVVDADDNPIDLESTTITIELPDSFFTNSGVTKMFSGLNAQIADLVKTEGSGLNQMVRSFAARQQELSNEITAQAFKHSKLGDMFKVLADEKLGFHNDLVADAFQTSKLGEMVRAMATTQMESLQPMAGLTKLTDEWNSQFKEATSNVALHGLQLSELAKGLSTRNTVFSEMIESFATSLLPRFEWPKLDLHEVFGTIELPAGWEIDVPPEEQRNRGHLRDLIVWWNTASIPERIACWWTLCIVISVIYSVYHNTESPGHPVAIGVSNLTPLSNPYSLIAAVWGAGREQTRWEREHSSPPGD